MVSKEVKVTIIEEIEKNQELLFGARSQTISKKEKSDLWKKIFEKVSERHGTFSGKNWTYLRDAVWPNMKKCALLKYETLQSKTARRSGRPFDDLDKRIRQVALNKHVYHEENNEQETTTTNNITKPTKGRKRRTNSATEPTEHIKKEDETMSYKRLGADHDNESDGCENKSAMSEIMPVDPMEFLSGNEEYEESSRLKREKLILEVEILRKTNYKMDLELLKLELETKDLAYKLKHLKNETVIRHLLGDTEIEDDDPQIGD